MRGIKRERARERESKREKLKGYSLFLILSGLFHCLSSSSFDDKDTYEVPVMVNATTLVIMLLCFFNVL